MCTFSQLRLANYVRVGPEMIGSFAELRETIKRVLLDMRGRTDSIYCYCDCDFELAESGNDVAVSISSKKDTFGPPGFPGDRSAIIHPGMHSGVGHGG